MVSCRTYPAFARARYRTLLKPFDETLGFLEIGTPQDVFSLRMPAQVDLVQLVIVRQENDFRGQLLLGRRRQGRIELAQQLLPVREPGVGDDDGGEVHMHLVAGLNKVVDGGHPLRHRRRPDVNGLRQVRGHQRKADPGVPAVLPVQHCRVDELGGKGQLRIGQFAEKRDKLLHVVADQCIDRAVTVFADVVDPEFRVALVGLQLDPLADGVPLNGSGDLANVGEDRDRIAVALVARHVAVGAGHGAAVGCGGCDEVC